MEKISVGMTGIHVPAVEFDLTFAESFRKLPGDVYLGVNFRNWFGSDENELCVRQSSVCCVREHILNTAMTDRHIEKFRGNSFPQVPISVVYSFFFSQLKNHSDTVLCIDEAHLFYVPLPRKPQEEVVVAGFYKGTTFCIHSYKKNAETPEGEDRFWYLGTRMFTCEL